MKVFLHEILRKEFRLALLFSALIFAGFLYDVSEIWMMVQIGGFIVLFQ